MPRVQKLHVEASSGHRARHLYLEVTSRCDLNCTHCSIRQQIEPTPDPGLERIREGLAGFREAGGEYLTISGGEPGLRNDLEDLISSACALGLSVTVFTNGRATRASVLAALSDCGGRLALSLDAPSARTHDRMRGRGSFRKARVALDRALEKLGGDHVIISSVLSRPLLAELPTLWELAGNVRVGTLYLGMFEPLRPGLRHPFAPTGQELVGPVLDLLEMADCQSSLRLLFSESNDLIQGRAVFARRLPKTALGNTVKLQADGWALPGPFYYARPFRLGHPMREGWTRVLTSPVWRWLEESAAAKPHLTPVCRRCIWRPRCGGGSLALTWAEYGSWEHACPLCDVYQATLERAAAREIRNACPSRA